MGRRRPLGLGLLLALAVEPPLLLPLLSSAPQAGLAAKPSLSLTASRSPSPSDIQARMSLHWTTAVADEGPDQQSVPTRAIKALFAGRSIAVAPESASRRQSPD